MMPVLAGQSQTMRVIAQLADSNSSPGEGSCVAGLAPTVRRPKAWRVLRRASADLARQLGSISIGGSGLGVLTAFEGVDAGAVDPLIFPRYRACIDRPPGIRDMAFFDVFSCFPDGINLRMLADFWNARGPQLNVFGTSVEELLPLANLLVEAGRARQFILGSARCLGEERIEVELALVEGPAQGGLSAGVALGPRCLFLPQQGDSTTSLAERSLTEFHLHHSVDPTESALVFSTFLGSIGDAFHRHALGLGRTQDFRESLTSAAHRLGYRNLIFLGGTTGAGLSALMVASDLVRTGRVRQVLVCSADMVQGAFEKALSIVGCEIPNIADEGCVCVLLQQAEAKEKEHIEIAQFGPEIHPRRSLEIEIDCFLFDAMRRKPISEVITTGCTDLDMEAAASISKQLWPSASLRPRNAKRMLATDVPAILVQMSGPFCAVSANVFGGTGVVVRA